MSATMADRTMMYNDDGNFASGRQSRRTDSGERSDKGRGNRAQVLKEKSDKEKSKSPATFHSSKKSPVTIISLLRGNWCWIVFGATISALIVAGIFSGLYTSLGWLASVPFFVVLFFVFVLGVVIWCVNIYRKEWSQSAAPLATTTNTARAESRSYPPLVQREQNPSPHYGAVDQL